MKERRSSGATHSFRLSMQAAGIVDGINHPRRLGGKSRKVSEAIEWYYSPRGHQPSYADLRENIEALQQVITGLHASSRAESGRRPPTWRRLLAKLGISW